VKGRLCYFLVGARCLAFSGRSFFFTCCLVHLQRAALGFDGDSLISAVTSSETALFHVGLLHRIFFHQGHSCYSFVCPALLPQTNWTTNRGTGACFHTDSARWSQQQRQLQTSSTFTGDKTPLMETLIFSARKILPQQPKRQREWKHSEPGQGQARR
jgi:hypothetical protein